MTKKKSGLLLLVLTEVEGCYKHNNTKTKPQTQKGAWIEVKLCPVQVHKLMCAFFLKERNQVKNILIGLKNNDESKHAIFIKNRVKQRKTGILSVSIADGSPCY